MSACEKPKQVGGDGPRMPGPEWLRRTTDHARLWTSWCRCQATGQIWLSQGVPNSIAIRRLLSNRTYWSLLGLLPILVSLLPGHYKAAKYVTDPGAWLFTAWTLAASMFGFILATGALIAAIGLQPDERPVAIGWIRQRTFDATFWIGLTVVLNDGVAATAWEIWGRHGTILVVEGIVALVIFGRSITVLVLHSMDMLRDPLPEAARHLYFDNTVREYLAHANRLDAMRNRLRGWAARHQLELAGTLDASRGHAVRGARGVLTDINLFWLGEWVRHQKPNHPICALDRHLGTILRRMNYLAVVEDGTATNDPLLLRSLKLDVPSAVPDSRLSQIITSLKGRAVEAVVGTNASELEFTCDAYSRLYEALSSEPAPGIQSNHLVALWMRPLWIVTDQVAKSRDQAMVSTWQRLLLELLSLTRPAVLPRWMGVFTPMWARMSSVPDRTVWWISLHEYLHSAMTGAVSRDNDERPISHSTVCQVIHGLFLAFLQSATPSTEVLQEAEQWCGHLLTQPWHGGVLSEVQTNIRSFWLGYMGRLPMAAEGRVQQPSALIDALRLAPRYFDSVADVWQAWTHFQSPYGPWLYWTHFTVPDTNTEGDGRTASVAVDPIAGTGLAFLLILLIKPGPLEIPPARDARHLYETYLGGPARALRDNAENWSQILALPAGAIRTRMEDIKLAFATSQRHAQAQRAEEVAAAALDERHIQKFSENEIAGLKQGWINIIGKLVQERSVEYSANSEPWDLIDISLPRESFVQRADLRVRMVNSAGPLAAEEDKRILLGKLHQVINRKTAASPQDAALELLSAISGLREGGMVPDLVVVPVDTSLLTRIREHREFVEGRNTPYIGALSGCAVATTPGWPPKTILIAETARWLRGRTRLPEGAPRLTSEIRDYGENERIANPALRTELRWRIIEHITVAIEDRDAAVVVMYGD